MTTLVADKHGEAMFHYVVGRTQLKLYVYTDQDRFCPETSTNSGYYYYDGKEYGKREDVVDLFTDRSLYRPGQTVNVNAIAYSVEHHKDKTSVNAGKEITLKLRDVNYKVVKELEVSQQMNMVVLLPLSLNFQRLGVQVLFQYQQKRKCIF